MVLYSILAYFLIGVLAGLSSGLLGIGGGAVTVPALLLVFSLLGFEKETLMHMAIGTSMASMAVNSLTACYFHEKKKNISWPSIYPMLPGVVLGSLFGALTSKYIPSHFLQVLFGLFACLIGLQLFKKTKKQNPPIQKNLSRFILSCFSFLIAFTANILGIGGGVFLIPLLLHYQYTIKKAIGVSLVISFLVSFLGTMSFLFLQDTRIHYIYLQAFIIISLTSLISSFYGTKLSACLDNTILKKVFALSMIFIGILMIF